MKGDSKFSIEFSGDSPQLTELTQRLTYQGLLEGLPTHESNARLIEGLRNENPGIHIVSAVENPIERQREQPYPFGTPASLPSVLCIAQLRSIVEATYSRSGTFLWFQDTWAMPIQASILDLFRAIDWSTTTIRELI